MNFTEMDPEDVQNLLEGVRDIISPEVIKQDAFLRSVLCRNCGGQDTESTVSRSLPFRKGEILPNKVVVCKKCKAMTDPTTGLIIGGLG
jgi:hypothetical protein